MKVVIQSSTFRRRVTWNAAARSEPVELEPGYAALFVPSDFPGLTIGIEQQMSDDTWAPLAREGETVSITVVAGRLNVIPFPLVGGAIRFVASTPHTSTGELVSSSLPL